MRKLKPDRFGTKILQVIKSSFLNGEFRSTQEGKAQYFLTTDDKILKKLSTIKEIKVIDPIEFIKLFENYDS